MYCFDNFQKLSNALHTTQSGSSDTISMTGEDTTRPHVLRHTTTPRSIFMSQVYSIGG